MSVIINFKICDNNPACNGIAACSTGALHYDYEENTIKYDEEKCIQCGSCACCPAGAIHFVQTDEEKKLIQKEIEADPRKVSDLFIQRYGAQAIQDPFIIKYSGITDEVKKYPGTAVLELITEDVIECLVSSIPIKELLTNFEMVMYRKCLLESQDQFKTLEVKTLPCLMIFKNGEIIGKIEGYYSIERKERLIEELSKYLKKV